MIWARPFTGTVRGASSTGFVDAGRLEQIERRRAGALEDLADERVPLECGPLEAMPRMASPGTIERPSTMRSFSTTPTQNPARSYSPSGTFPASRRSRRRSARSRRARSGRCPSPLRPPRAGRACRTRVVEEEKRLGPWTRTSFTLIATRSMPTVSWRSSSKASLAWADAVGAGDQHRRYFLGISHSAPKPPMPARTSGRMVPREQRSPRRAHRPRRYRPASR